MSATQTEFKCAECSVYLLKIIRTFTLEISIYIFGVTNAKLKFMSGEDEAAELKAAAEYDRISPGHAVAESENHSADLKNRMREGL